MERESAHNTISTLIDILSVSIIREIGTKKLFFENFLANHLALYLELYEADLQIIVLCILNIKNLCVHTEFRLLTITLV